MGVPDASDWDGAQLDGFLSRRHFEGDVVIWGVEVFFCAEIVDIPVGKEPVWTYMATVYAPDGGEDFPEATPDAAGILTNTRQVLRSIAPSGAVDAWLCRQAIASGLQPSLPL